MTATCISARLGSALRLRLRNTFVDRFSSSSSSLYRDARKVLLLFSPHASLMCLASRPTDRPTCHRINIDCTSGGSGSSSFSLFSSSTTTTTTAWHSTPLLLLLLSRALWRIAHRRPVLTSLRRPSSSFPRWYRCRRRRRRRQWWWYIHSNWSIPSSSSSPHFCPLPQQQTADYSHRVAAAISCGVEGTMT